MYISVGRFILPEMPPTRECMRRCRQGRRFLLIWRKILLVVVHRMKTRELPGGMAGGFAALIVCAAAAILGLALGVPALIAAFGG